MNSRDKKYFLMIPLITFAGAFIFYIPDCLAGEGPTPGRRIYNNIMLLVNFGILVFFIVRYGKKPLLDYLLGVRENTKKYLDEINGQFADVKDKMDAEEARIKDIEKYIEEMRKNILELGRKEKEKMIDQGKAAADKIIRDARAYAGYQIALAKKTLTDEIVEAAISMVKDSLVKGISEKDNENLINQFIVDLETSERLAGEGLSAKT
ncbi:MAG: hypothetical protein SV775_01705 [Thermodesulfobacteriota bacterium]|nr:hypothetical protein [Thermodesulfobacteriota bacterium]